MDHTWTTTFCVTLAFLSGTSCVRLLIGSENGYAQLNGTRTQERSVVEYKGRLLALDYHYSKGYIYFSSVNVIKRYSIHHPQRDIRVITAGGDVHSIAVDWINDNLYWTRTTDAELVMADLDGNRQTSVITKHILNRVEKLSHIIVLYGIEVDPYERTLFMIAGRDFSRVMGNIVKTDLEGRNLTVITRKKYELNAAFTIDRPHKVLYVVTITNKYIYACTYNGEIIGEFLICPKISWIYQIKLFQKNIYMAFRIGDEDLLDTLHVQPFSSMLCSSEPLLSDKFNFGRVYDMKVYDVDAQPPLNVYNSYKSTKQEFRNWDECSLLSTEWERIDCLELNCSLKTVNNKSSSSVELLLGRSNGIIQLHNPDTQETKVIVKDSIVRSLDYHYSKGYIFYSGNTIMRLSLDTNINNLKEISDDRNVYGIAVDWINDHLYWTRSIDVEVVKADLDGNHQISIITSSFFDQRKVLYEITYLYNIEVDPYERTLFMIAGSARLNFMGTLVKSDLEGRNLSVITHTKYKYIAAFTIDRPLKILYMVNTGHNGVYSCRYNGEVIEEFSVCPKMYWIYPFTTFRQNMYMAYGYEEEGNNNIFHLGKLTSVKCPIDSLKSDNIILGIKVYSVDVQQPLNVSNSYQPIKQRFSNWNKCSLLPTEWKRRDCLKRLSLETAAYKRSRYISHERVQN